MWRYLLARSPPLLSHLWRPPGSTGNTVVAAVGCANRGVIHRAYASGTALTPEDDGARPRRHLYVVLDQINAGHSIYKLNIDDLNGGDEDALTGAGLDAEETVLPPPPCRFPEAVLRLGVSSVGSELRFEGLGSKIVVVADEDCQGITFIYDTKTTKLDTAKPPADLFSLSQMFLSVGDKLHLLTPPGESSEYLCEVQAPELNKSYLSRRDEDYIVSSKLRGQLQRWAWKSGPSPPPLPEDASDGDWPVQSYAVHPDGHTIFFASPHFTFSLDTNGDNPASRIGEWVLPFHGRAYYDHDLDAWIGIRKEHDMELRWGRHYLCSCDVPSVS